ncbi:glucosaminidase domain-containing protein [Vibrio hannami]|uniref:glucosaminidase domain-containing protein n=1 Tax=Vibrio hannami TaxID=2717094 RepID=UPI00240FA455|nr:glucosaminidase domain-containing protein [Vibrio hannami]MDG3088145.1 glucosaminidase domain-containing protein [Vibrio hannami]
MRNVVKLCVAMFLAIATFYPFFKSEVTEIIESVEEDDRPDFKSHSDVNKKKIAFFDYLRGGVERENKRIESERGQLLAIKKLSSFKSLTEKQVQLVANIASKYKLDLPDTGITEDWLDKALLKVNVLPESLVLTQAANESAWGTSRFAVEGNNFFGQWCYTKGCGLIPLQRNEDATHEVAKFASAEDSIHAYFMNVNRNRAYQELREIRQNLATEGKSLLDSNAAIALTQGLHRYSERGHDYVDEIQAMIRVNKKYWTTQ